MQSRSNSTRAIVHVFKAHSVAIGQSLGEPTAIVRNTEDDFTGFPAKRDDNHACLPVGNGVVNGFLRDPIKMHGCVMIRHKNATMTFEPTGYGEQGFDGNGQFLQRCHQPRRTQGHRVESTRDLPCLYSGPTGQLGNSRCDRSFGWEFLDQFIFQGTGNVGDARQLLTQAVMQILSDPLLFIFAGL